MCPTVLVTFSVDEERHVFEEILSDIATIDYLEDVSSERRLNAITAADYIVSFIPDRELTEEEIDHVHSEQVVQLAVAGVDHVPFDRLPEDIQILSNAGAYAEPMAEHILALYLALAKRFPIEHHNLRHGEFNQYTETRWIEGSICGIYGFGATGEATARLMKPLGIEIHAVNRSGESTESISFLGTPDRLDDLLESCDGVVVAAPLTPETRGSIGRNELEMMADDAFLILVSRGELVDQQALYDHLRANPSFQAGIESWWVEPERHGEFSLEYPFLELPNVIGCPHNSAMVPNVLERGVKHAAENIRRSITTGDPRNVVDRALGY